MTEHIIKGDKTTTYFDFKFEITDNFLIISSGEYWLAGEKIYAYEGGVFELEEGVHYSTLIMNEGIINIPTCEIDDTFSFLDKLAWGTINNFHTKKIVTVD